MKFTVLWAPNAESKLANLWMRAADRQAITQAADRIDRRLRDDPLRTGESRALHRRIFHEPPLGVSFAINSGDRKVLVLDVWHYEPRP